MALYSASMTEANTPGGSAVTRQDFPKCFPVHGVFLLFMNIFYDLCSQPGAKSMANITRFFKPLVYGRRFDSEIALNFFLGSFCFVQFLLEQDISKNLCQKFIILLITYKVMPLSAWHFQTIKEFRLPYESLQLLLIGGISSTRNPSEFVMTFYISECADSPLPNYFYQTVTCVEITEFSFDRLLHN